MKEGSKVLHALFFAFLRISFSSMDLRRIEASAFAREEVLTHF